MKRIFALVLAFALLCTATPALASHLGSQLRGRILLQVEENGEAWYIHPITLRRHFLNRPEDAFRIMREQAIGVSNENLDKIEVGFFEIEGVDTDKDGLADTFEEAIGTNLSIQDTDGDGINDGDEIRNGSNPKAQARILSPTFTSQQLGKIFLQVEGNGEAWYLNPVDRKRYYMGRPSDAFKLMKFLGLGITNDNLNEIVVDPNSEDPQLAAINCDLGCFMNSLVQAFPEKTVQNGTFTLEDSFQLDADIFYNSKFLWESLGTNTGGEILFKETIKRMSIYVDDKTLDIIQTSPEVADQLRGALESIFHKSNESYAEEAATYINQTTVCRITNMTQFQIALRQRLIQDPTEFTWTGAICD